MRIEVKGVDPASGELDPHGIPQIACPARRDDVNPQFTCLTCPCAVSLETHEAVDDLGLAFHLVDAVECDFREGQRALAISELPFPDRLRGNRQISATLVAQAVECPLLRRPEVISPLAVEANGRRWVKTASCGSCQFYRGLAGESAGAVDGSQYVQCSAPRDYAASESSRG